MALNISGSSPNLSSKLTVEYLAFILGQWRFNTAPTTQVSEMQVQPNPEEGISELETRLNQALSSDLIQQYPVRFNIARGKSGDRLLVSFSPDTTNQRYQGAFKLTQLAKGWLGQQGLSYSEELDHQGLPQLTVTLASKEEARAFEKRFPLFVLTKEGGIEFYPDQEALDKKYPYDEIPQIDISLFGTDYFQQSLIEANRAKPIQGYLLVNPDPECDRNFTVTINLFEADPREGVLELAAGSGVDELIV